MSLTVEQLAEMHREIEEYGSEDRSGLTSEMVFDLIDEIRILQTKLGKENVPEEQLTALEKRASEQAHMFHCSRAEGRILYRGLVMLRTVKGGRLAPSKFHVGYKKKELAKLLAERMGWLSEPRDASRLCAVPLTLDYMADLLAVLELPTPR